MNILLLTNEYPPHIYGGAGVHVDHLVREVENCDNGRHRLQILCFGDQQERGPGKTVTGIGPAEALAAAKLRQPKILDTLYRNVVMAGDGQMDPKDLPNIIEPVARGEVDYTKGNRLFQGDAWEMIPHHRYLGNSFLSLLTKFASGYWHIADSQTGYTGISLMALNKLDLDGIYKSYGMPNDILIKLNQFDFRVRDVHVKPVYHIGEKSKMKVFKVIPRIFWLLFKGFWRRIFFKYVIKDFHPLVFFYVLSFLLLTVSLPLTVRLFYVWAVDGAIPRINAMALVFTLVSGLQSLFFGMWFDMEYNKDLK